MRRYLLDTGTAGDYLKWTLASGGESAMPSRPSKSEETPWFRSWWSMGVRAWSLLKNSGSMAPKLVGPSMYRKAVVLALFFTLAAFGCQGQPQSGGSTVDPIARMVAVLGVVLTLINFGWGCYKFRALRLEREEDKRERRAEKEQEKRETEEQR